MKKTLLFSFILSLSACQTFNTAPLTNASCALINTPTADTKKEQFACYKTVAEQGNIEAQYTLGAMYFDGKGVEQNRTLAKEWYQKSAEQGNIKAQASLGFMYASGKGVPQNYALAKQWFQKAAEQNDVQAQHNLGFIYEKGMGTAKDYALAKKWYQKAAAQGNAESQYSLDIIRTNEAIQQQK